MSEYIKREDVIKAIEHISCDTCKRDKCMCKACEYGDSIDEIEDIPPADVVEVVRCKNCKHHEELLNNNDGNVLCWVHGLDVIVDRNGYCNYGERKEQEHE